MVAPQIAKFFRPFQEASFPALLLLGRRGQISMLVEDVASHVGCLRSFPNPLLVWLRRSRPNKRWSVTRRKRLLESFVDAALTTFCGSQFIFFGSSGLNSWERALVPSSRYTSLITVSRRVALYRAQSRHGLQHGRRPSASIECTGPGVCSMRQAGNPGRHRLSALEGVLRQPCPAIGSNHPSACPNCTPSGREVQPLYFGRLGEFAT